MATLIPGWKGWSVNSLPVLVPIDRWAEEAGMPLGEAERLARTGQLEDACVLPGGGLLVRWRALRVSRRVVPGAPYVRLSLLPGELTRLESRARAAELDLIIHAGDAFVPRRLHKRMLLVLRELRQEQARAQALAVQERRLAHHNLSRLMLTEHRADLPERSWQVLVRRYALEGGGAVQSVAAVAAALCISRSEVDTLEHLALAEVQRLRRRAHVHGEFFAVRPDVHPGGNASGFGSGHGG